MRIRSTKPEFWRSDDVAALTREERLLFLGLWSYVDDNGVGIDDHRQIAADLFALDEDQTEVRAFVRDGLATLSRRFLIVRYEVSGKRYIKVTGWHHQRIDKPAKPRFPEPPSTNPKPPTSGNVDDDDEFATSSRQSRDTVAPGTGEQGNRGTGEPTPSALGSAPPARRARKPRDPKPATTDDTTKATRIPPDFTATPDMATWAQRETPDVDGRFETAQFRDYWSAASGGNSRKRDWTAAWRTWMRRAQQDTTRARNGQTTRRPPTTDELVANAQALKAELARPDGVVLELPGRSAS